MKRRVIACAVGSRLVVLAAALIFDLVIPDHDAGGVERFDVPEVGLNTFTRWDAAWFLRIAAEGYNAPERHAFFPLLPMAMSALSKMIAAVFPNLSTGGVLVVAGLLISNGAFVGASVALYQLSCVVLDDEAVAWRSVQMFCLSPAGIFFSCIYTESLFALLTFWGFWMLAKQYRCMAALLLCISGFCRFNGLTNAGIPGLELLASVCARRWRKGFSPAVIVLAIFSPYCVLMRHWFLKYCLQRTRPPWCDAWLPSLYAHIQREIWNNGFLRYWQLKQIPNFILAAPITILCASSALCQWRAHRVCLTTLPLRKQLLYLCGEVQHKRPGVMAASALPYFIHWALLTLLAILFMNVQVTTRLVCANCPAVYWWLASVWDKHRSVRVYLIAFNLLGAALHPNFLPWT